MKRTNEFQVEWITNIIISYIPIIAGNAGLPYWSFDQGIIGQKIPIPELTSENYAFTEEDSGNRPSSSNHFSIEISSRNKNSIGVAKDRRLASH